MRAHKSSVASADAYYQMIAGPKLGEQQKTIVAYLAEHCYRDWTRAEIAHATGLKLQSVCGRVNELVERQSVVASHQTRKCSITGSAAHPLKLAPTQSELFA